MRLLITRPEPDNERTAATLRALSHEVMLAPLLRIEAIGDADLGAPPWAAILLTSANGARAIAGHPRRGELMGLPVLAVGESTAIAARAAGFGNVTSADGDARDLVRLAVARFTASSLPLLYLAGEDRTGDLAGELAAQGQTVRTVVIYRAAKAPHFPAAARTATGNTPPMKKAGGPRTAKAATRSTALWLVEAAGKTETAPRIHCTRS